MISHFAVWHIGNDRSGVLVTFVVASCRARLDAGEVESGMAGMKCFLCNVFCILCSHKAILGSNIRGHRYVLGAAVTPGLYAAIMPGNQPPPFDLLQ